MIKSVELAACCLPQWEQFMQRFAQQRLHHAMLLVAPLCADLFHLTDRISAALLCSAKQHQPCGRCKSCQLCSKKQHPDWLHVQPEKSGGMIKVEQIRSIHELVFTSPQLNVRRVIQVSPVNKMNYAAANAFLKLLEEPPADVSFILLAEQTATLLPTILSRCQIWRFPAMICLQGDYLSLAAQYPEKPLAKSDSISALLQDLLAYMSKQLSVCQVATKWLDYELADVLWLFYLINAQMIHYQLVHELPSSAYARSLEQLTQQLNPVILFQQLDKINQHMKALTINLAMNQTLVLESLLLGYRSQ